MEQCNADIKKVVAAIDLSSYSEITFVHALDQAKTHGAELILVNVINDRGLVALDRIAAEGYDLGGREDYINRVEEDRAQTMEKDYLSRIGDVPTKVIFRVGNPYEEILNFLKEEKASMVVTGTKGHGNLAGALFGSVAEKVFRRATCLVLSVRGPEHCRLP